MFEHFPHHEQEQEQRRLEAVQDAINDAQQIALQEKMLRRKRSVAPKSEAPETPQDVPYETTPPPTRQRPPSQAQYVDEARPQTRTKFISQMVDAQVQTESTDTCDCLRPKPTLNVNR